MPKDLGGPSLFERRVQVEKNCVLLARCVMAVDPDSVMVTPTPMPWNPHPVNAADVIARPIGVIRPVTKLDVHNNRIYHGCHCCEHCQKYPNFPFHTCNSISD